MKTLRNLFVRSLVLGLSFIFVGVSIAQATTVSPPVFDDIFLNPGQSYSDTFSLFNEGDQPVDLSFSFEDFVPIGEEGKQTFTPEIHDLSSWITTDHETVSLQPGDREFIEFTVNVPEDATPGGHYAAIFAVEGAGDVEGSGVGIGERLGVLLLINVSGDVIHSGELLEFALTDKKSFYNRVPVNFFTRMKNEGTVHFKPTGSVEVDGWGKQFVAIQANPFKSNVLPGAVRRIDSQWSDNEDKSKIIEDIEPGSFLQELGREWSNFRYGKFKASLQMRYGEESSMVVRDTVTFWVIPWHVLVTVLALLILVILIFKGYNTIVVKGAMKKMDKPKSPKKSDK